MAQPPPDHEYVTPRRPMPTWMRFLFGIGGCLVLGVLAVAFLAALAMPFFTMQRGTRRISCASNSKQLATAMMMYAQDYDERFPPAKAWQTGLDPYVKNSAAYLCPERPGVAPGFAFNAALDRKRLDKLANPALTPVLFESSLNVPNASDRLQSFVTPHHGAANVSFADGHVMGTIAPPPATAGFSAQPAKP